MLGLCFCARAFSSCGERGPLFIAVCGPLTVAASLVAEHKLQTRRLSSCGSRAQLLRGMWDLPRPGHEPVSPALAGGFSTTAPPGKPLNNLLLWFFVGSSPLIKILCYMDGNQGTRTLHHCFHHPEGLLDSLSTSCKQFTYILSKKVLTG